MADAQRGWLLPGLHRSPFDRMLVAQTPIPLVSIDAVFDGYGVNRLWWSAGRPRGLIWHS